MNLVKYKEIPCCAWAEVHVRDTAEQETSEKSAEERTGNDAAQMFNKKNNGVIKDYPSVRALLLSEGASLEGAAGAAATAWNAGAAILGAAVAR